jgi:hypothetical protein
MVARRSEDHRRQRERPLDNPSLGLDTQSLSSGVRFKRAPPARCQTTFASAHTIPSTRSSDTAALEPERIDPSAS